MCKERHRIGKAFDFDQSTDELQRCDPVVEQPLPWLAEFEGPANLSDTRRCYLRKFGGLRLHLRGGWGSLHVASIFRTVGAPGAVITPVVVVLSSSRAAGNPPTRTVIEPRIIGSGAAAQAQASVTRA